MYQYLSARTTLKKKKKKKKKEKLKLYPVTAKTSQGLTEKTPRKQDNKHGKKKNYMDILSDQQARLRTRRPGELRKETFKRENLFF